MSQMLVREFDRAFNELFGTNVNRYAHGVVYHYTKTDNEHVLEIPLPGSSKEDVKVTVEKDVLKVTAKKNASRFSKEYENSWLLLDDHDVDNVKASMENGVLTVKVGRVKPVRKVVDVTVV